MDLVEHWNENVEMRCPRLLYLLAKLLQYPCHMVTRSPRPSSVMERASCIPAAWSAWNTEAGIRWLEAVLSSNAMTSPLGDPAEVKGARALQCKSPSEQCSSVRKLTPSLSGR